MLPNADETRFHYRFSQGNRPTCRAGQGGRLVQRCRTTGLRGRHPRRLQHGDLDAGDALAAYKPLTASKTREVFTSPLNTFNWILSNEATTDGSASACASGPIDAYLPKLQELGYHQRPASRTTTRSPATTRWPDFLGDDRIAAASAPNCSSRATPRSVEDGHLGLDAADRAC